MHLEPARKRDGGCLRFSLLFPALLAGLLFGTPLWAGPNSKEQVLGLDEEVQDLKSDVLSIASELSQLEEKLLYPSGTQVSLFVSLAKGEKFRLDAVTILLDGKEVARHLYTFKELEALQNGGVQRIYTGNIMRGEHALEVAISGKSEGGDDYRNAIAGRISKDVGPRLVDIKLAGPGSAHPGIDIKEW